MAKRKKLIGFISKSERSGVEFWLYDDGSLIIDVVNEKWAKAEHREIWSAASCELDAEQVGKLFAFLNDTPAPERVDVLAHLKEPYRWVITPESNGTFYAQIEEFPGCFATGSTMAEAIETLAEVAADWLAAIIELGQQVPKPRNTSDRPVDALRAEVLEIIRAQPFYPDTNVGMRQQWVKDQIGVKVRVAFDATPTAPCRAVDALRPFLALLETIDAHVQDDTIVSVSWGRPGITVGDLRQLRRAAIQGDVGAGAAT